MKIITTTLIIGLMTHLAAANLIRNQGFEVQGENSEAARYWRMHDPDDQGDAWGTAIRADWRAKEGSFIGAIRGQWAGLGDYGGFWQDAEVVAGTRYKVSAWFWADASWQAGTQELKLEFWNRDRSAMLDSMSVSLDDVGELWMKKEIEAAAPEGAGYARVVINVSAAGNDGALQVDEVELVALW